MAIKDDSAFADLKPYLKRTVAPNGVTVGDLNFVVAQTQWSTALQAISTNDTVPADVNLDLFQVAQGDPGQGFATGLTRGQTSWKDSQGRLPANQVFIATSCGFQIFRRSTNSTVTNATEITIPKLAAVHAIGRNLSWEVTIGDGITRNYGSIIDFAGYGAQWSAPNPSATNNFSSTAILGEASSRGRKLRIPLVFPPNISVRIKVRSGNLFTVDETSAAGPINTLPTGTFLAVRQFLHGYLCTMPVG